MILIQEKINQTDTWFVFEIKYIKHNIKITCEITYIKFNFNNYELEFRIDLDNHNRPFTKKDLEIFSKKILELYNENNVYFQSELYDILSDIIEDTLKIKILC